MKPRASCQLAQVFVVVWFLHASTLLPAFVQGQDEGFYGSSGLKHEDYQNSSEMYVEDAEELTPSYNLDQIDMQDTHRNIQYRCQACQYRNVYAMASLKSIKAHVLMKLGIDFMPNRTGYPSVPEQILSSFNKQMFSRSDVKQSSGVTHDPDYMEDDPMISVDEVEEDYDYYPVTNKIYILAKRE
uniref:Uncharacterized protein n=1 Tax=Anopheles funestus TaxID=62324 RepID=A0A182RB84_ANOFN